MSYEKQNFENGQRLNANHLNHIEHGIEALYGEFGGSVRPWPWAVKASSLGGEWNTFLDLDHQYFYRVSYDLPASFGLPVVGKSGVLVPFYAGTRGENRDWPTMYLCGFPDGDTGQYYIAYVGSTATLADVHWQKITIDSDKIWAAINGLDHTGHFICLKEVMLQINTADNTITVPNGFIYTAKGRIDISQAVVVTRDTSGAVSFLVYDRNEGAIKSLPAKSLAEGQVLIAILSKADPTNANANYIPGKWSVDGVVYPKADESRLEAVEEQVAAVVAKASNVGPFITFKDTVLDIAGGVITLNEGYIYARNDRIKVEQTELTPADGTTMAVIVYDLSDNTAKTITGFDGFLDSQILIAVVALNKYQTSQNANYIPGKWSVDGVIYPQSASGAVSAANVAYVSTDGSDGNDGSQSSPYATINKAISSGASTVYVKPGTYKEAINAVGNGGDISILAWFDSYTDNKVVLDFSQILAPTLDSVLGLQRAKLNNVTDEDFIYKAFVSKTEDLIYSKDAGNYGFGFTAYSCNLWKNNIKLTPVLTISECQATEGTWTYNGTNVYVNGEAGAYTLADGSAEYGINLEGFRRVILDGLDVRHVRSDCVRIYGCADVQISRCNFSYAGLYTGLALVNSSGTVRNCEAMYNKTDGLNIHGGGTVDFIDCISHDNDDDGISHHDTSGGMVIGGEYYNNGKGGVCSPTQGSRNGVQGVYIHDNAYGVYALADKYGNYPLALVSGCAIVNNDVGIRTRRYHFKCWNNVLSGNAKDASEEDGGTIGMIQ